MERTQKSWGAKWTLFQNDLCEVNILYLNPQNRCSWHRHQAKFNQFFVIEGEIHVKTEYGTAKVEKNQIFTTNPGGFHEFQTKEMPAIIQEIMFVKYDPSDIERETLGGPLGDFTDV